MHQVRHELTPERVRNARICEVHLDGGELASMCFGYLSSKRSTNPWLTVRHCTTLVEQLQWAPFARIVFSKGNVISSFKSCFSLCFTCLYFPHLYIYAYLIYFCSIFYTPFLLFPSLPSLISLFLSVPLYIYIHMLRRSFASPLLSVKAAVNIHVGVY